MIRCRWAGTVALSSDALLRNRIILPTSQFSHCSACLGMEDEEEHILDELSGTLREHSKGGFLWHAELR
jgi:hypothetical protein